MANTQYIKEKIEPFLRKWLAKQSGHVHLAEGEVSLGETGHHRFDAVSVDGQIIAAFACNRPRTGRGKENTGAVRKALNDIQFLNLVDAGKKYFVCTDEEFPELIKKRAACVGLSQIRLIYCKLPCSGCPDKNETLEINRNNLTFSFFSMKASGRFYLYIDVTSDRHFSKVEPYIGSLESTVRMTLSDLMFFDQDSKERFKPNSFDLLQPSKSALKSFFSPLDLIPIDGEFTFKTHSHYVRVGYPGEVSNSTNLVLTIPPFLIDDKPGQLPDIEFKKTKKFHYIIINC